MSISYITKRVIKTLLGFALGRKIWQPFWVSLYRLSLNGMHIGPAGELAVSGERNVLNYIKKKYTKLTEVIVFDVGANKGDYSVLTNKILKDRAKIYAFEPAKITYERMTENTKDMKNIERYNLGFSDKDIYATLYYETEGSGLASIYKRNLEYLNVSLDKKETITLHTLDGFCKEKNIPKIHLLKLDIEGGELLALNGAKNKIDSGGIDYIQFEFGGCNIDSRTYFQDFWYLLSAQYRFYRIIKDGIYEIKKYSELNECFLTTNFLAERKVL
ncbi:MAG: FkbM family methyltransferase [Candidatus Margulisbacteria bacterium]|jgi:FkbM family methyltransferase|nr:FkbM family methyltransferase [Candidatus Margulisiibacteriota bacterium]